MLPSFVLLALPPPLPSPPAGVVTATVLCEWLGQATGIRHAVGGELRDYPLFLAVRAGGPGRVEALVATALAGEWTRDGATLRLLPKPPKPDEGLEEFARAWKAATAHRPSLAALAPREAYAMRAGEIRRFGLPEGPFVRPLPAALRERAGAGGVVALRRFSSGSFETKVDLPDEREGIFSGNTQVDFHRVPSGVATALGEELKKAALGPDDLAALRKLTSNPGTQRADPKAIDRRDPLARFAEPLLNPLARALKEDLVVALPDFAVMGLLGQDKTTVEGVLGAFCLFDDWTMADGALVGRLPVSERRDRAQTRRGVLADFVRRTGEMGVPSSSAVAEYLAGQRPAASESWVDVMMLVLSGVVLDESNVGDYPFNLRLASALSGADWARLRAGRPFPAAGLSPGARAALTTLLVQSRGRMELDKPDPVTWPGFPDAPLALTAKVAEEDVVLGFQGGITNVMTLANAGYGYARAKTALGSEPLYRAARRRALILTVAPLGGGEPVTTGFGDVDVAPNAPAVPWTALPPALRAAFGKAVEDQGAPRPAPPDPTGKPR